MPSKIQLDENLWFLFICLQKSDYKSIDFNAVGRATNLKSPAARMRYTRLRRMIESGLLMDSEGVPFGRASKTSHRPKRKATERASKKSSLTSSQEKLKLEDDIMAEAEDESEMCNPQPDKKVKLEFPSDIDTDSDVYETDSEPSASDDDDDKPQAKRRGALGGGAERFVLGTAKKVKCEDGEGQLGMFPDVDDDIEISDAGEIKEGNPAVPVIESPIVKAEEFEDEVTEMEGSEEFCSMDGLDREQVDIKMLDEEQPSPMASTPMPPVSCLKREKRQSPPVVKLEGDKRRASAVKKLFRNPWVQDSPVDTHAAKGEGLRGKGRTTRSI